MIVYICIVVSRALPPVGPVPYDSIVVSPVHEQASSDHDEHIEYTWLAYDFLTATLNYLNTLILPLCMFTRLLYI